MTNAIVTVNVSQNVGATPSELQRTGALISQGGTNTSAGTRTLITEIADFNAIDVPAAAISTMTWSGGVVTVTTAAAHGIPVGVTFPVIIAGAVPTAYNGAYTATRTGTSTFTYLLVSDPGTETTPGTYELTSASELRQMVTTFFTQGSQIGVYVLELGAGSAVAGVATLTTYLQDNPDFFYAIVVPRYWDAVSQFLTLIAAYEGTTAKLYFWVTTTAGTYTSYTATMKDVVAWVEAPSGMFGEEFDAAAGLHVTLNYKPSGTNKVTPFAFSYVFGVAPYPTVGTAALRLALKAAGPNIIAVGSEGGITNDIVLWGKNMDARPFNYWYSVDWAQINIKLNVANAVINGSNNPINPLYLNQDGINRLQAVIARTMQSAITFGLALGTVIQTELSGADFDAALNSGALAGQVAVNAIPFVDYYTANPGDYKIGVYDGFSVTYVPLRGFESITINLNVSDFVTA